LSLDISGPESLNIKEVARLAGVPVAAMAALSLLYFAAVFFGRRYIRAR
jgi:hypothetical protein